MEAKKQTLKLQIKKPKGEIKQFASYGLMEWGGRRIWQKIC